MKVLVIVAALTAAILVYEVVAKKPTTAAVKPKPKVSPYSTQSPTTTAIAVGLSGAFGLLGKLFSPSPSVPAATPNTAPGGTVAGNTDGAPQPGVDALPIDPTNGTGIAPVSELPSDLNAPYTSGDTVDPSELQAASVDSLGTVDDLSGVDTSADYSGDFSGWSD